MSETVNCLRSNRARVWLSMPIAFATGAAAVVLARLIRAALSHGELAGRDAALMMVLDCGVALVLAYLATLAFAARGKLAALAQIAGVLAMLVVMHDLVHAAPKLWTLAFSRDWVLTVLTTTEPGTVLVKGVSYRL